MKKVLITGASGFSGTYLSSYLKSLKRYKVYGSHLRGTSVPKNCTPVILDITKREQVVQLFKKIRPDYVCHLAAQSSARLSSQMIDRTYKVNIQGTLNIAEAIRAAAPTARLLYTSSVHVYGRMLRSGENAKESDPLWPESYYGISKAISELFCLDLWKKFGLDIVIVRAVNYFGPGQSPELVFSDWCRQIALIELKRQKPVIEVGNLKLKRDFVYIQDAVELYEMLFRKGKPGEIYNVASNRPSSLQKYLDYLISLSESKIRVTPVRSRFRADDAPVVRISNSKLRAIGWKPRHSVKNGLQLLLEDWRKRVLSE